MENYWRFLLEVGEINGFPDFFADLYSSLLCHLLSILEFEFDFFKAKLFNFFLLFKDFFLFKYFYYFLSEQRHQSNFYSMKKFIIIKLN